MTHAEGVVFALRARRERREAAALLDGPQQVPAPGEHLVGIRLVADVPNEPIVGGVEYVMQGDREFHGAEAGREVTAHLADGMDQVAAQLRGQRRQFGACQLSQIEGRFDLG